jgi:hypothetical protein
MGRGGEGREGRNEGCAITGESRERRRKQQDEAGRKKEAKEEGEQVEREQQRRFASREILVSMYILLRRGLITLPLFTDPYEVEVTS